MNAPYLKIAADVRLGKEVKFSGFANLYGCEIGDHCMIGPFVEIQRDVRLGRMVKVQSHAFICSGVEIGDEAFIGHGVIFINDRFPRSTTDQGYLKDTEDWECERTVVGRRASIGSNATILCGITIGEEAIIGAGSVVTKDVQPRAVVAGNPARLLRYVDAEEPLDDFTRSRYSVS
jgi:UDP-2-acetamido-3-amino-2,3-dideoxy-glucuronate N-acetyltransferase